MNRIKIACTSGILLNIKEMKLFSSKLKSHSFLEIERLCDSIINDGFLFPIAIGKVNNCNYIVDGECRYYALLELQNRGYEINEIPVFYVRSNEKSIKRNLLISTSTNHCVTESSLKDFVKNEDLDLKKYAFSSYRLIDFHTYKDIGLYEETIGGKFSEQKLDSNDFEGLLK